MARHQGRLVLHHLDLYRIDDPWEAWDLGLDEQLLGEDVCVVEWADKAEELFPAGCCWISLDYGAEESQRAVTLSITTSRYSAALQCLAAAFPTAQEVTK
jgi:tRNA threonylcarbamoyladenosine biosynthesis protein TsaE